MLKTMDELNIDEGIRDLVRQVWKHNYKTRYSCEGHNDNEGYILLKGGDKWLDENSKHYGLKKSSNNFCCEREIYSSICCEKCGAGVNGYSVYRGFLVQNPFKPNF